MVGAGGGFVLVPILLLLYPRAAAEDVTATSLFVVCANAASGTVAYARQRRIDYRSGIWFATATLPGAVAGAVVVAFVPRRAFDGIFATVLVALGLWLMLHAGATAIRSRSRAVGLCGEPCATPGETRSFTPSTCGKASFSARVLGS